MDKLQKDIEEIIKEEKLIYAVLSNLKDKDKDKDKEVVKEETKDESKPPRLF